MKTMGITGGIGSGKSTVCKIFQSLGYRIYDADAQAKLLLTENQHVKAQIIASFGEDSYFPDGRYNRAYIGGIVFKDKERLSQLNAIVHPATKADFENWIKLNQVNYSKKYVIKEAAILFESGAYQQTDIILSVYAPKQIRIERVMARDKIEKSLVLERINNQWADSKKIHLASFSIFNDGIHPLIPQILQLEKQLCSDDNL